MKPYIICHMVSSVDGKIDGSALSSVMADGEYEATGAKLKGDAWICGRTTMQQHFAQKKPFVSVSKKPAGPVGRSLSPAGQSPMPFRSTRSASCVGRAAIWMATTSFVW